MRAKLLLAAALGLVTISTGCIRPQEPNDLVRVWNLGVLAEKDAPLLSEWLMVCTDDQGMCLRSVDGDSRETLSIPEAGIYALSFHPTLGCFAYSSDSPTPDSDTSYYGWSADQLVLVPRLDGTPRTVFRIPKGKYIDPVSISPDGRHVAFLVGEGHPRHNSKRRLYVGTLTEARDALVPLRDCGDISVKASMLSDRLIWRAQGRRVYWTNRDGRIGEFDVESGTISFHEAKASQLFAVTEDAFVIGRARYSASGWDLVWTVVAISRTTAQERVVTQFRGLDYVTNALMVPDTSILALNVNAHAGGDWKACHCISIMLDISSGKLLGRTQDYEIDGFIRKKQRE